jgi:hypothetical protein
MSSTTNDGDVSLLQRVEQLLEESPEAQESTLQELQKELGILRIETSSETLEKIFQSFGTAVGKHGKIEQVPNVYRRQLMLP